MTARRAWKAWLFPGGALLAAAVALVNSLWLTGLGPSLNFYYFAAFAAGLLLAWRFNSSRVLFSLLVLLLVDRAVQFFSAGDIRTGPGRVCVIAVGLLIPLNSILFAYMRERGLMFSGVAPRFVLLFLESVLVAVVCRPESTVMFPAALDWMAPVLVTLSFAGGVGVLFWRFCHSQKPVEIGFVWSLAVTYLWLRSPLGPAGEVYMATAGLILAVALIETSYVLAYHDELTGIPGRRAFNEALLSLGQQYAIAIADIDHFKKFNDTYGHEVGDQVLRLVASRLAAVGGGGQAYRSGGEEFAIIFRNTSAKDAYDRLEPLRQNIANTAFRVRGVERRKLRRPGDPERRKSVKRKSDSRSGLRRAGERNTGDLSVTVSIGVAEPGARYREPVHVIEAADRALYAAKHGGRNRVEMASAATPKAARTRQANT